VKSFKDEFARRGISVAVVSFAEPARLIKYQEHHNWPFVMLADPDRIAYHTFGLKRLSWLRMFSPATVALYFKLLREGKRLQRYGDDDYAQGGGDFIIDSEGNILFVHRSRDPADRPTTAKLLQEIDQARK
jgi:peroxiredoxin